MAHPTKKWDPATLPPRPTDDEVEVLRVATDVNVTFSLDEALLVYTALGCLPGSRPMASDLRVRLVTKMVVVAWQGAPNLIEGDNSEDS